MNANAEKWVKALENGEYKQGKGLLRKGDEYCCLGVACDLALKNGVEMQVTKAESGETLYNLNSRFLPIEVNCWLGLRNADTMSVYTSKNGTLVDLNDNGHSFSEIAEIIRNDSDYLFLE